MKFKKLILALFLLLTTALVGFCDTTTHYDKYGHKTGTYKTNSNGVTTQYDKYGHKTGSYKTDSQGRTVDFKNTILILTSNLGSPFILEGMQENGEISEDAKNQVNKLLRQQFRPEFLNRLDEIVFYKPLLREQIFSIVDLQLKDLKRRLSDKQLDVEITEAARNAVVDNSYDVSFGARPLKRYMQQKFETLIAKHIISDDPAPGTVLKIDYQNGEFVLV
mgnify:CR=1 FL=1